MLAAPLVVFALACAIGAVAFFLYQGLGEELVPQEDRGIITVRLTGPDGVGLDHMDRQVEKAEDIVRPLIDQGVADRLYSITGRYDFNRGQIDLPLRPWGERAPPPSSRSKPICGSRSTRSRASSAALYRATAWACAPAMAG